MNNEDKINNFIETIKLSDCLFEKIKNRYESIGEWLKREDSKIKKYNPIIYPQGSVRVGTIIKPLSNGCYDVDLVCQLDAFKEDLEPKELKKIVGEELKLYVEKNNFKKHIKESKKCWTIEYSDEVEFHVDILPAINKNKDDSTNILITNNENIKEIYEDSNPKGFSEWLKGIEKESFDIEKEKIKRIRKIEKIEEYNILTPLKKIIMLLKRHRDVFFELENNKFKTASIIINILCAKCYNSNLKNIEELLKNTIHNMEENIEKKDNILTLKSPASEENFLDKWNKDENYKKCFDLWIKKLKEDIVEMKYFLNSCKDNKNLTNEELNIFLHSQRHVKNKFTENLNKNITCIISNAYNECYNPLIDKNKEIKNRDKVTKNIKIKFRINTNIDKNEDYIIYWRIINTGSSAFISKCLRGDFYRNENPKSLTRIEPTKYSGIHSAEAFIVKNNEIIAKSEPFIIKIE